jgi:hypothetical protein
MSAVLMSCAMIGLHGATRVPDDLFLDDTDVSIPGGGAGVLLKGGSGAWAGDSVARWRQYDRS